MACFAMIIAEMFGDSEFHVPNDTLRKAGHEVVKPDRS
jgi:putative intracellular protease/amidase